MATEKVRRPQKFTLRFPPVNDRQLRGSGLPDTSGDGLTVISQT
jgi:hypothetical protein